MADRPLFYWPLDEASGPVSDLAGHAAASAMVSGQRGVAGISNTGITFDGQADSVRVPFDARMRLTGSFSLEVWAKLGESGAGAPSILSIGDPNRGGLSVSVSSLPTRRIQVARNGTQARTFLGLTDDRYRQLVFTYDARDHGWQWYVDGVRDAAGELPAAGDIPSTGAGLQVGGPASATGGGPSRGLSIDAVSIYPTALSAGRVRTHYAAGTGAAATKRHVGGVATGGLQPWNARRGADYAAMQRVNMTWIRTDLGWHYLEPIRGQWRWNLYDPVVSDATNAGLNYLAVLHTVPTWANDGQDMYAMPADLSLVTDYCYRTAQHYIPMGVLDYEIGNEVNLPHGGWPDPDPARYVRTYLAPCAVGLRRAAGEAQTTVNIMLGSLGAVFGIGFDPVRYLRDVYRAGGAEYFDSVAWHPYTGGKNPATHPFMNSYPGRLHDVMAANGDSALQIWATEFGHPTGGSGSTTEQGQAALVGPAFDTWYRWRFTGPLMWYSGRDIGTDPSQREEHFGLLRYDGSPKPAYAKVARRLVR